MKIIEYFTSENPEHWLAEIKKSDWDAGQYLYALLRDHRFKELAGRTALVPLLIDEETNRLVSFCTFAPLDDIQPTNLSPWIGFVYTFPGVPGPPVCGTAHGICGEPGHGYGKRIHLHFHRPYGPV